MILSLKQLQILILQLKWYLIPQVLLLTVCITYNGLVFQGKVLLSQLTQMCIHLPFLCMEGAEGNFDLTYNVYGSTAPSGIIGCENNGGTAAKMLGDAVTNFKNATGASGDIVYRFIYGTQAPLDAAVISTDLEGFYKTASTVNIAATVTNFGTTAITTLDLNYTIGAGATQTTALTGS